MALPWSDTGGWSASVIVLRRTLSPWPSFRRRVLRLEARGGSLLSAKARLRLEINHILLAVRARRRNRGRTAPGRVILLGKCRLSFIFRRVAGVGITEGPALAGARAEVL